MLYINDEVSRWIHCHLLKLISKFFERRTTAGIQHPAYTAYTYIKSVSKYVRTAQIHVVKIDVRSKKVKGRHYKNSIKTLNSI